MARYLNRSKVYELLDAEQMSKEDLSRLTGISRSTIYRILDDPDHNAQFANIVEIAHVLRVTVDKITQQS